MKPKFVIIAGVNGAGKSTYYDFNKMNLKLFKNIKYYNVDDKVKEGASP